MLFEIVLQRLGYGGVHYAGYLGVAEFGFCLTFELRLCDLDGDHCRQSFAEIVGVDGRVAVFVLEFGFLEHLTVLGVLLHDACERSAETCDVCTALYGVDIVDVRVYVLVEVGVVDHGDFHGRAVLVGIEVNNLADERCAVAVDETYELGETFLGVELLAFATDLFRAVLAHGFDLYAFILEHDFDSSVQERQFAHTVGEDIPLIDRFGENRVVRPELNECTVLTLLPIAYGFLLGDDMYRSERFAFGIILAVDSTAAIDLDVHLGGKCVDATNAHAVQTAGNLVTILVELTSCVEYGHNDLQC